MNRAVGLLAFIVLFGGCSKKPSAADAAGAIKVLEAFAAVGNAQLLYAGCAEIPSCAAGCAKELTACASPDTDDSQRAALLASCSGLDYRARRDQGEQLTPEAWATQHFSSFLDALVPVASAEDQKRLTGLRQATKL